MSDLMIHDFRDRAERGLDVPDIAEIQRRGRSLRRRRAATAVGSLALVLAAAGGVTGLAADRDDGAMPATPPDPSPSPAWDSGIRTDYDHGEEVLEPGTSYARYGRAIVSFTVPDQQWEWWDVGLGLRRTPEQQDSYTAAVFFMPQTTARLAPCDPARSQPLGTDPERVLDNVAPLVELADSSVLQGPREVRAFGTTAVHLQLEAGGGCKEYGTDPAQLRGVLNAGNVEPGWTGRHVLDLWHVVVPSQEPQSLLVASWDLDHGQDGEDEVQALIDSIEIEPVD